MIGNLNLSPSDAEILKKLFRINSENKKNRQEVESNLKAVRTVLANVLGGNIGEAVIDSLVNPSFDSREYLLDKNNERVLNEKGVFIRQDVIGNLNLSPSDAEILKKLFRINSENKKNRQEVESNLKAVRTVLGNVLEGNIGEAVIDSLVNPIFDSREYLLDKNNKRVLNEKGFVIPKDLIKNLNLSPNDAEILKTIQKFCSKPEFPDEYKKNFSEFLSSGDTNILKNFKSSLESQEVKEETQELIQVIDKLVKSTEVLNLKKEIYTGIADNRDTNELRNLVNNYEVEGTDDINLKRELLKAILGKDSQDIIVKTVEKLEKRNPAAAIAASAPLLAINLEAAQGLRKLAYRIELSDYGAELEKRLTEDLNNRSLDFSQSNEFLRSSRLRPAIGEFDYIKSIQEIQEKTKVLIEGLTSIRVRQQATELRENFGNKSSAEVLQAIGDLGAQGPAISAELSELYKTYATANLPGIFKTLFLPQI